MITPSLRASPQTPAGTRSRALLVGVSHYGSHRAPASALEPSDGHVPDGVDLPDLNGPVNDVKKIYEVLTAGGVFDKVDIDRLTDPGIQAFKEAVADLLDAGRNLDTVLLYYSGHGWLDDASESLYLCPSDAGKGSPRVWMIDSPWISRLLEECPAKTKIVVLDCCFAGKFKGDLDETVLSERLSGSVAPHAPENGDGRPSRAKGVMMPSTDSRGLFVLCAGSGRIPDGPEDQPSPFTRILATVLEGMFGTGDPSISMEDLFNGVKSRVADERLPIRPSRKAVGETVALARKTAAPAGRVSQAAAPSWPHIDLAFSGSTVTVKLPDGRTLDKRVIPTRRRLPHDSLLAHLLQLATNDALCEYLGCGENPDARQSLRNSLDIAYRMAGEDLFSCLFEDAVLRQELFRHLKYTPEGHSLELRLDMTQADPAIAALRWETMAIPGEFEDDAHSSGPLATTRNGVLIDRRVGTQAPRSRPLPGSKSGGQDPRWVLLRSEFAQDHPLAARVEKDLDILAHPAAGSPALIHQPYAQFQQSWAALLDHLDDGGILSMVLEVTGSESEPVLQFADANFSQISADTLASELQGARLSLVVLETLPPAGGHGNGFAFASGVAWALSQKLTCPVVAVSHSRTYVQWLRTDAARDDTDLYTVTGLAVRELCSNPGLDACLAHAARKGLQNKVPNTGIPVVYLPDEP